MDKIKLKTKLNLASILLCFFFILSDAVLGCTGIQLKTKDGSVVHGRSDEFGVKMSLSNIFVPRDYELKGTLPDGSAGFNYRSKYAAIGASTFGDTNIIDGINEKGLAVAAFYFPGYAVYAAVNDSNKKQALSPSEFNNWILTQFSTVEEVKNNVKSVVIVATKPKGWPVIPPFHYIVYDKQGNSIVIEPTDGQIKIFDNPLGVITNSPTFDWHMTNLRNFINLSPVNVDSKNLVGLNIEQLGQGSGLHGMPGDFTPPSRFVRAVIFAASAIPSETSEQAVMQLFHILNQFDIPLGSVREGGKNSINELTVATVVRDPNQLKFYYKTFDDQNIKVVDLNKFDFNSKTLKVMSITGNTVAGDVSASLK